MQFTVDTIAKCLGIKNTRGIATVSWWVVWTRDRVRPTFMVVQAILAIYGTLALFGDKFIVG